MAGRKPIVVGPDGRSQQLQAADFLLGPGTSVLTTPNTYPSNLTLLTAPVSGTAYFQYVGNAPYALTTLRFCCQITTAVVGQVWAEIAVFKGAIVAQGNASLTRLGFTDVRFIFDSNGLKNVAIALANVTPGDQLWICYGSSATTPFVMRGLLADPTQCGALQLATVRPSLATNPQAVTLQSAGNPGWISAIV